jgi:protein MON2
VGPQTVRAMVNAGWTALLAALSFLLTTNLSEPPIWRCPQRVAGARPRYLRRATPSSPHLQKPPSHHVSSLLSKNHHKRSGLDALTLGLAGSGRGSRSSTGLNPRILVCLRALVTALMFLAGMLGSSWFAVLEALQTVDYVLTMRGTAPPSSATLSPNTGATYGTPLVLMDGGTCISGAMGSSHRSLRIEIKSPY